MEAWFLTHPIPAGAMVLGLAWLLKTIIALAWPLVWKQTCNDGLMGVSQCSECREELESKLAAGDDRFDVTAEVDAFMLRWMPAMCKAVGLENCDLMEREAAALITRLVKAGRGGNHGR